MRALGLYFTGTGNTKWVAEELQRQLDKDIKLDLKSIEMKNNNPSEIAEIINEYEIFGIFYPIYGSGMPKIVREFMKELVDKYASVSETKIKAFSITSVALFSGDGALMPKEYFTSMNMEFIWAYNVRMPSNIGMGLPGLRIPKKEKLDEYLRLYQKKAKIKIEKIARNIIDRNKELKGTGVFNVLGGKLQRVDESGMDKFDVKINHALCVKCGICISLCPMDNLSFREEKEGLLETHSNCTLCLRCIHNCPQHAIRAFNKKGHRKFNQYNVFPKEIYKNMI